MAGGKDSKVSCDLVFALLRQIDEELKDSFHRIRTTRHQFPHLWSKDYDNLSTDAVRCYGDALKIVAFVLRQTIRDGKLVLDAKAHPSS